MSEITDNLPKRSLKKSKIMNLIKEPNQLLESLKVHEKEIARLYEVWSGPVLCTNWY